MQSMVPWRFARCGQRYDDFENGMTTELQIEKTFREEHGRVLATLIGQLGDFELAEDALQDALVIAWRDLPSLRDPDRFDAWLHKVLTNVCIAQAGRERRRMANLHVLPVDGPPAPDQLLSVADRDNHRLQRFTAAAEPWTAGSVNGFGRAD